MRQSGKLTQWDAAKGYGFITPDGGGAKLFVHIKAFGLRAEAPRVGETLSYETALDAQGKRRALQVRGVTPVAITNKRPSAGSRLWLIPGFAALYLAVHLRWPMPTAVWGAYMAMSLATFIVYAGDKRAARLQQWRVSEGTLHGLAMACGWPGALLAQQLLRHKSAKPAFRRAFWLTVVGNVLLFIVLFTPLRPLLLAAISGG